MKFYQLPIGSHFTYQGDTLLKTSPLVASLADTGQKKFMPRSAEVVPVASEPVTAETPAPQLVDADQVQHAFEDFHAVCQQHLDSLAGDVAPEQLDDLRQELARARGRFLHRLRLPG